MRKKQEEAERQRSREAENHRTFTLVTHSPEETLVLGRRCGELLESGQVVALCGPLGAGKTTFTKGVAQGLGVEEARDVKSPTFVLIKEYAGRVPIAHVDLYRIETLAAAERLDLQAYFDGAHVCLIEWAEKFPALLPSEHLRVTFAHRAPTEREITVEPRGARATHLVAALGRQPRHAAPPARRSRATTR